LKVLYLAAGYPQARVNRWLRSLAALGCECVVAFGRRGNDLWKRVSVMEVQFRSNPVNPLASGRHDYIISVLTKTGFVPALIIVQDLFLSLTAQKLSRHYRAPLVLDIADNYPEVARQRLGFPQGIVAEYLLNKLEQKACRWADAITFVSQDSMEWISRKHRIDLSKKGWVLPNFPMREDMGEIMVEPMFPEGRDDSSTVKGTYIGDFNPRIRDFATVLTGLRRYNDKIINGPKVRLVILAAQVDKMKNYFSNLDPNYEELVTIKPVIPRRMLQRELRQFDFGLVPHVRSRATDYTVPNKLFDYLLAGLPFLASNNPAIVNAVAKHPFGEFYDPRVLGSFEEALSRLVSRMRGYKEDLRAKTSELRQSLLWDSVFEQCWTEITNRVIGSASYKTKEG